MKRQITLWQTAGFALTLLLGTILHFLYGWLNGAAWIAPFASINESTWEHMKLLFWPMFLFATVEWFFFCKRKTFWCIKLRGIALGLVLMPVLFYTYNGVIGTSPAWVNILIFVLCAASSFTFETKAFNDEKIRCKKPKIAFGILILIAIAFVLFTFFTPDLNIFKDPLLENDKTRFLARWY